MKAGGSSGHEENARLRQELQQFLSRLDAISETWGLLASIGDASDTARGRMARNVADYCTEQLERLQEAAPDAATLDDCMIVPSFDCGSSNVTVVDYATPDAVRRAL